MTLSVFIDGAVGTTGLEIAERLAGRSEYALVVLDEDRRKDTDARAEALNDCDVAILCLPDDAAREAVALVQSETTRIIDASSAHRVATDWTYGFPELIGYRAVAEARRVSNPGCYPTGFLGLVAPLVRAGILPRDLAFTCHAVSGYSGGGKALIGRYEQEAAPAFRAYGLTGGHKHLPEMQVHADLAFPPVFSPAVVPAFRGMLVEVPLSLAALGNSVNAQAIRETLGEFYADTPLVSVAGSDSGGELLLNADFAARDDMVLHVFGDDAGTQVRLIAMLDNLGKGASGAAVQTLNLMAGIDPLAGLRLG